MIVYYPCSVGIEAFGASTIYMTKLTKSIKESITKVGNIWGGESDFNIEIVQDWKNVIYNWKKIPAR